MRTDDFNNNNNFIRSSEKIMGNRYNLKWIALRIFLWG